MTGSRRHVWTDGYSQAELDEAQEKYGLTFPPDLVALYRNQRLVDGYDWRTDDRAIREMLAWPLEGLLFDIEHDQLWWAEWGPKPTSLEAAKEVLRAVVAKAPKLIPIYSHRYIPAEPCEPGNPVFSVYQSDTIYYGANLTDYFEREFGESKRQWPKEIKHIAFWSDLVERNR